MKKYIANIKNGDAFRNESPIIYENLFTKNSVQIYKIPGTFYDIPGLLTTINNNEKLTYKGKKTPIIHKGTTGEH